MAIRVASVLFAVFAGLAFLGVDPAGGQADPPRTEWRFAIGEPDDVPREDCETPMFAFLLDVDEAGAPTVNRSWRLRGTPPPFREHTADVRIYSWRLLDARGDVLAGGRHLDKLAMYVPRDPGEGGCDKLPIGRHSMMIRTPAPAGAVTLAIGIEETRTAHGEVK